MAATPPPVEQRIELAEAYIELVWTAFQEVPRSRGGIIADARYAVVKAGEMEKIDWMLDKLSCMYAERDGITIPDTLEAAS